MQSSKGSPCYEASQGKTYKIDMSKFVNTLSDFCSDFLCCLGSQRINGLVHIVGDGLDDEDVRVFVVSAQVVLCLLEVEAVTLIAVHEDC